MYKIAIDLGYGYVKGMNEEKEKIIFPSIVGTAHDRALKDLFGTGVKNRLENLWVRIKTGNLDNSFFVGNLAGDSISKSFIFDSNKIWHPNNIVLLGTAAALLAPEGEDVLLVTGLPLEHFRMQRKEFSNFLKEYKAEIGFPGDMDLTRQISFASSAIFPQAAGALYEAVRENPGLKLNTGTKIAVIDIGFKTSDFITVRIGTPLETMEQFSGTIEAGMFHLHRLFTNQFLQETGFQADPFRVSEYIRNDGVLYFDGKKYDFSDTLRTARKELVNVIYDSVIASWKDNYREFRAIFLAGGGASELENGFKDAFPILESVSDPQFANCKGFLYYAGLLENRIKNSRL